MSRVFWKIKKATAHVVGKNCEYFDCAGRFIEHPCMSDLGSPVFKNPTTSVLTSSQKVGEKVKLENKMVWTFHWVKNEPRKTALFLQYQNHYFQQTFAADSKTLLRPDELFGEWFKASFQALWCVRLLWL